jgi:hypothetical protein
VEGCGTVKNRKKKRGGRRCQPILEPFSALMLRQVLWPLQGSQMQSAGKGTTPEEQKGYEENEKKTRESTAERKRRRLRFL